MGKKKPPKPDFPKKPKPEFPPKPKPKFPPRAKPQFPQSEHREGYDKIDHNLLLKIDRLGLEKNLVLSAIIKVAQPEGGEYASDWLGITVTTLMARVARLVEMDPNDVDIHMFPSMDAFSITAPSKFLKILIEQPEIQRAVDNNPEIPTPFGEPPVQ